VLKQVVHIDSTVFKQVTRNEHHKCFPELISFQQATLNLSQNGEHSDSSVMSTKPSAIRNRNRVCHARIPQSSNFVSLLIARDELSVPQRFAAFRFQLISIATNYTYRLPITGSAAPIESGTAYFVVLAACMKIGCYSLFLYARFDVLTSSAMKITVLWDVTPCSLVDHCKGFGGICCLDRQGRENRGSRFLRNFGNNIPH
jgi:hypothetical protein